MLISRTGYRSAQTVTRPANQTPYTANDVVGGVITFTGLGVPVTSIHVNSATLRYDVTAVPSGMTSFRLHLYSATPPSAYADNAAWDLPSGDRSVYLGYIDLGSPSDLGSTLFTQADGLGKQLQIADSGTLYGYLVTAGGYTPAANSETLQVALYSIGV